MAHKEKLPWELIEEILFRVDPPSLVRFKTVCKQWNALFNEKTFINNHKTTFQFILATIESKLYSVRINPKIEVRELTLDDIPGLGCKVPYELIDCNDFMLCGMDKGTLVWNPWLKQTRWIKPDIDQPRLQIRGIGYKDDGSGYKALATYRKRSHPNQIFWKIGDLDSDVWKSYDLEYDADNKFTLFSPSVSLDGSLYLVASYKNDSMLCLVQFDFSIEGFNKCDLPCGDYQHEDALVLRGFKGDRLSLLKQCHLSKKIEVWVTKNKIHKLCDVEWVNIMEVSSPNLPCLQTESPSPPSYFIDDKRLVVCSSDKTGRACIYVLEDKKLISKTKLDLVVDLWPLHCTYFSSLASVPRGQREEIELDI